MKQSSGNVKNATANGKSRKPMRAQSIELATQLFKENEKFNNWVLRETLRRLGKPNTRPRFPTLGQARGQALALLKGKGLPKGLRDLKVEELAASLKRLLAAKKAVEALKKDNLAGVREVKAIVLYGSTGKGNASEARKKIRIAFPRPVTSRNKAYYAFEASPATKSDIDLFIVVSDNASPSIAAMVKRKTEAATGSKVDVFREGELRNAIENHEGSMQLRRVLLQPHIPLYGEGFTRSLKSLAEQNASKTDAAKADFYTTKWATPVHGSPLKWPASSKRIYGTGFATVHDQGRIETTYKLPKTREKGARAKKAYLMQKAKRKTGADRR